MLTNLIKDGFGSEENYNCAEKIFYGANIAYDLDLSIESLKLSAGFGGGMGVGSVCGTLAAAVMALSNKHVINIAHESDKIKEINKILFNQFLDEMGSIQCEDLKKMYKKEDIGCYDIILKAAQILDSLMESTKDNIKVACT